MFRKHHSKKYFSIFFDKIFQNFEINREFDIAIRRFNDKTQKRKTLYIAKKQIHEFIIDDEKKSRSKLSF